LILPSDHAPARIEETRFPVPVEPVAEWVFNPVIDRLLRLQRGDRREFLARVRASIAAFPGLARYDRRALIRGIVRNDAANRLIFRLCIRFPKLAKAVSRLVLILGGERFARSVASDRPVILGLMHFGPIHLCVAVSMKLLRGRSLYVLHAGGESGHDVRSFLERIGSIPVLTDRVALQALEDIVAQDPRAVVLIAFDHIHGKRRRDVPFFGGTLSAPTGLAYLANRTGATVITAWYESSWFGPRLRIGEEYRVDETLEASARQDAFHDRMFRALEERVRSAPQAWTEWGNCLES